MAVPLLGLGQMAAELARGYSSVVEHLTADQEVPGSNPGAPWGVPVRGLNLGQLLRGPVETSAGLTLNSTSSAPLQDP